MRDDLRLIGSSLVSDGAFVYISGYVFRAIYRTASYEGPSSSNQMPRAVKLLLAEAVGDACGCSIEDGESYLKVMEESGRLFEECWS